MLRNVNWLALAMVVLFGIRTVDGQQVDFGTDVLPILSDTCFRCHGMDANTREADLRLDTREGLFSVVDKGGTLEDSELYNRIVEEDPDTRMPPPDSHRQLKESERDVLRRWLQQGASWSGHWAFQPIIKPELPESSLNWGNGAIDAFVRHKLTEAKLTPSKAAKRHVLLRRVSLDLTGLPPDEKIAQAFLDATEAEFDQAYTALVDQLLDSPAFGERMASVWMEIARYADSDGFQLDQIRTQYPWRDWVIRAFNQNMPYDQFILEQIAGDLLPDATEQQIIATGFNRNHITNGEGGVDPNETRIEVVADRTETTATVFLGLTVGCCRCHDHKYDPLTQEDYFRLFAYFNNVDEDGKPGHRAKPYLEVQVSVEHRKQVEDYQANAKHHRIAFPEGNKIRVGILKDRQEKPRKTYLLNRGVWNEPTREVTAAPPAFLATEETLPRNRLGLARWITRKDNPLAARVAVNRFWELFFGRGLVTTQEDFGIQGDRPSHPKLLDWLAADFQANGWNVKRLLRQIVLSRTYRQSSATDATLLKSDPNNEWLARGSRFRHPSWLIRDQALAVSGLLNPERFGPSVRPYQPANIWFTPTAGKLRYVPHSGKRLYRKSLYTFWRRNIGPANMFDASRRRVCQVKARRTNTPLHALTTLNDVTYVESARVLAELVLQAEGVTHAEAARTIFQRVLQRPPTEVELNEVNTLFDESTTFYREHPEQAAKLLKFGEAPTGDLDQAVHAAMTNVALLVLNLDETLCHY